MKNILLLLLLFTGIVNGQIVNIPDANFKSKLLSATSSNNVAKDSMGNAIAVDTNNDTEVQVSEALNIAALSLSSSNILSLTGIEAFTNLKTLVCNSNQLTSLDVSMLSLLTQLRCSNNNLTSLLLSPSIKRLDCNYNQLTQLDLNGIDYQDLQFSYNQLTSITIPHCSFDLGFLNISGNLYTTIDLSNVQNSDEVDAIFTCEDSQLESIDLSNLFGFKQYNIRNNPNLLSINFKNGHNDRCVDDLNPTCLDYVDIANNPSLTHVCVDEDFDGESELAYFTQRQQAGLIQAGLTISTYCSFTPGGTYNTITGTALYDILGDGCGNDTSSSYIKLSINDGTNSGSTFTNNTGAYTFYTQTGAFTVMPELENPSWYAATPSNAVLNFPLLNNSTQSQDFCINANGIHPDVEIVFTPTNAAIPGLYASYKMVYKNKGNQTSSGTVTINFNNDLLNYWSSSPSFSLLQPGLLTLDYSNLQPFETRIIDVEFQVLTLQTNSGDLLQYTATINPIPGDETPLDNVSTYQQTVVNSYEPNEILCLEGNTISPEDVGNYLHYNVNFENIGTTDAINIVVKDTINTAKFNINSLQLQYASHDVETKVSGNIVEFIFKNIHLQPSNGGPIGGHGNVLFKIKTLPTLTVDDEVMQNATIFFDYNAPITTNEERTLIASLSKNDFIKDETIAVAPNPTKNRITVSAKNKLKSMLLFDVQGRLLQTILEHNKTTTLDISNQANGVYFLKVITEVGSSVEKIVKEN